MGEQDLGYQQYTDWMAEKTETVGKVRVIRTSSGDYITQYPVRLGKMDSGLAFAQVYEPIFITKDGEIFVGDIVCVVGEFIDLIFPYHQFVLYAEGDNLEISADEARSIVRYLQALG